jgi:hypothetical protein
MGRLKFKVTQNNGKRFRFPTHATAIEILVDLRLASAVPVERSIGDVASA